MCINRSRIILNIVCDKFQLFQVKERENKQKLKKKETKQKRKSKRDETKEIAKFVCHSYMLAHGGRFVSVNHPLYIKFVSQIQKSTVAVADF